MNLYDPGTLKRFLDRHNLSATKGLGQHFLVSRNAVDRIIGALQGISGVLEIGPGPGVLTGPASSQAERMIALELDRRMIEALKESAPLAEVRQIDALKAPLSQILAELPQPRAVVSNLPYYITGPLLTRIAEAREAYATAVLMMQKEVAQRVMAPAGSSDRGSLSVYLQAQFEIAVLAQVPAGAFYPPPKVDSTVLKLSPKPVDMPQGSETAFFGFMRAAFGQPRKTLANNLLAQGISREESARMLDATGLDARVRPQQLTVEQWKTLFHKRP